MKKYDVCAYFFTSPWRKCRYFICLSILHNVFDDGSNWVRVSGFILSLKFATLFVFQ